MFDNMTTQSRWPCSRIRDLVTSGHARGRGRAGENQRQVIGGKALQMHRRIADAPQDCRKSHVNTPTGAVFSALSHGKTGNEQIT